MEWECLVIYLFKIIFNFCDSYFVCFVQVNINCSLKHTLNNVSLKPPFLPLKIFSSCIWMPAWYVHLLLCNIQIPYEVLVAFSQRQTSSGGNQPYHDGLAKVTKSRPICSWLPAYFLALTSYSAGSFCLLPYHKSCFFLASFVQTQSWQQLPGWLGCLCSRSQPCLPSFVLAVLN